MYYQSMSNENEDESLFMNQNQKTPKLLHSHEGEYSDDYGGGHVTKVSKKVKLYAMCAALNSCNLGYDIGVNTGAGILLQESLGLSDLQIEIFLGSLNLFAIFGALSAHTISDRFGRRYSFVVRAMLAN